MNPCDTIFLVSLEPSLGVTSLSEGPHSERDEAPFFMDWRTSRISIVLCGAILGFGERGSIEEKIHQGA